MKTAHRHKVSDPHNTNLRMHRKGTYEFQPLICLIHHYLRHQKQHKILNSEVLYSLKFSF